ncbi:hypothetical protein ACI7YT_04155 [Microbacterium sp. M]|uniref:hypothetical protein n=1 Tax=Microbacterium sp. M TaxID=3377125 RepID=UPI00386C4205
MTDAWDGIALEFLHNNATGARLVVVAGADDNRSRRAADALATALEAHGESVERADTIEVDPSVLREQLVSPFRADREHDRVLVLAGPDRLLADENRGMWHFALWHSAGDEPTHADASALVDMTDPAAPRRRYADSCGTAECCSD